MAQKEGGTEQGRVKTGDHLGAKAMAGASTAGGGVVVEVREKKGPLRAAIPTMPFPLAVICLFLNTFIPGLGKSGITLSLFTFPNSLFLCFFVKARGTVKKINQNKQS